jgi:hypothetical protein
VITPEEAGQVSVPAARARYLKDVERSETMIRSAAENGWFYVDVPDVQDANQLFRYLKSCGFTVAFHSGIDGVRVMWPTPETKK